MHARCLVLALGLVAAVSHADPPTRGTFRAYGAEHGLGNLAINALAQTDDGLLWVGTEDGVYAFDGARFIRFGSADGLPSTEILSLLADGDRVWVGTLHGVVRLHRGHVEAGSGLGSPAERVLSLSRGADGTIWAATDAGVYVRRAYLAFVPDPQWPAGPSAAIRVLDDGTVVAGHADRLARRSVDGSWTIVDGGSTYDHDRIEEIASTPDRHVWLRSARTLSECDRELATCIDHSDELADVGEVGRMFVDRDGALRVATRKGLVRRVPGGWDLLDVARGLPVRSVISAFEDDERSLWVVGDQLYQQLGQGRLTAYDASTAFPGDTTWSIMRTSDGHLWVGTNRGVAEADGTSWRTFPDTESYTINSLVDDGPRLFAAGTQSRVMMLDRATRRTAVIADLPGDAIETMALHDHALWVGTWNAGLWRLAETATGWSAERVSLPRGTSREDVNQISVDREGRLWIAGELGVAVLDRGRWRRFTREDGLLADAVYYVLARDSGEICVGYDEPFGVSCFQYRDGLADVRHIRTTSGLRSDKIYGLGEDVAHRMYVLEGVGVDVLEAGNIHHFSTQNGMVGDDCAARAFWADGDQTVFVGTTRGLARMDMTHGLEESPPRSPVVLRTTIDRATSTLVADISTPALSGHDRLEEQVRLLPDEQDWRTTSVDEVRYLHLSHGHYQLEVRARYGAGQFSKVTAFAFEIPQVWWREWWARALAALLIAALVAALIVWRVRVASERESAYVVARSEASFRTLIELSQDAVFVHRDGIVVYANPAMARMLRDPDGSRIIGRSVIELVDETDRDQVQERIQMLANGGDVTPPREFRMRALDGTSLHVEFWAMSVDFEGQRAILATGRDQTERKALEARFMTADRLASIGTLAAGVAHEINNPLAYVMSSLAHLTEELGHAAPTTRAALDDALDGAKRIQAIVGAVRTFSRVEASTHARIDLGEAVTAAYRLVANELKHRCEVKLDLQAAPAVSGNSARIGQVVINLVLNAVQAMPDRPREQNLIAISTRTAPDGRAVLEVRDNGSGMTADVKRRAFEPFFTTKGVGSGSGLGLSVCHGIVASLGGEITVTSAPGEGATFTVLLPPAPATAEQPVARAATNNPDSRMLRVLVIDDDARLLSSLGRMLRREFDVTTCNSGEAARELMRGAPEHDVILCDLMMPGVTGMELHDELARERPELARRMVFMTGGVFTPDARAFTDQHGCRVLEKPFDIATVRRELREASAQSRGEPSA